MRSLEDKKLYIGVSNDPKRRLAEHNKGKNKSTRPRKPFILLYTQMFLDKKEAYKFEWYVKNTGEGNKKLKKLLPE